MSVEHGFRPRVMRLGMSTQDELLSTEEVAELLTVGRSTG